MSTVPHLPLKTEYVDAMKKLRSTKNKARRC